MTSIVTVGDRNVDWRIFLKLSDKDFISLCRVSKAMLELCENEAFWELKSRNRYPTFLFKYKKKPKYLSWKAFYIQTRSLPHSYNVNLKSLNLVLAEEMVIDKRHTDAGEEKIRLGDLIFLSQDNQEYEHDYFVIKIETDKMTVEIIKYIFLNPGLRIVFPDNSEKRIQKLGIDAYKIYFDQTSIFEKEDKMEILCGNIKYKYPDEFNK